VNIHVHAENDEPPFFLTALVRQVSSDHDIFKDQVGKLFCRQKQEHSARVTWME
jgi:hypothetical protein